MRTGKCSSRPALKNPRLRWKARSTRCTALRNIPFFYLPYTYLSFTYLTLTFFSYLFFYLLDGQKQLNEKLSLFRQQSGKEFAHLEGLLESIATYLRNIDGDLSSFRDYLSKTEIKIGRYLPMNSRVGVRRLFRVSLTLRNEITDIKLTLTFRFL